MELVMCLALSLPSWYWFSSCHFCFWPSFTPFLPSCVLIKYSFFGFPFYFLSWFLCYHSYHFLLSGSLQVHSTLCRCTQPYSVSAAVPLPQRVSYPMLEGFHLPPSHPFSCHGYTFYFCMPYKLFNVIGFTLNYQWLNLRASPELKSRTRSVTDWATQAPPGFFFFI